MNLCQATVFLKVNPSRSCRLAAGKTTSGAQQAERQRIADFSARQTGQSAGTFRRSQLKR
jgi:hypothetical protein